MIIGTTGTYLESFTIFHSGRNDGVKIWVFRSTREISRKVTPDIDFTDRTVIQCDVCYRDKNTFAGTSNLQIITNKF